MNREQIIEQRAAAGLTVDGMREEYELAVSTITVGPRVPATTRHSLRMNAIIRKEDVMVDGCRVEDMADSIKKRLQFAVTEGLPWLFPSEEELRA